jgi:hypothetical protein
MGRNPLGTPPPAKPVTQKKRPGDPGRNDWAEQFYLRSIQIPSGGVRCGSDDVEMTNAAGQVAILGFLAVQLDLQAQVVQRIRVAQGILVADLAGFV